MIARVVNRGLIAVGIAFCLVVSAQVFAEPNAFFKDERFTQQDAVLVADQAGNILYQWQADKPLIPASLTKLATAKLAIDKWGLDYRFMTDFYHVDNALWVKGYGDPFLVSEEFDSIVLALKNAGIDGGLDAINIDSNYFDIGKVPGRSKVSDPYNAPLSAVAANFNTAKLRRVNGVVQSAESQTPLTATAKSLSGSLKNKTERVNLINADNAQRNFAELLLAKLSSKESSLAAPKAAVKITINQTMPSQAKLIYRHKNSHTLADVLRGTLEFSNNFMANQVFLKLADQTDAASVAATPKPVSFDLARRFVEKQISARYQWSDFSLFEGSGLSRKNRLSAQQIDDLLESLEPNKNLLKRIKSKAFNHQGTDIEVFAKTGTLDGVRSYAGYISLDNKVVTDKAIDYDGRGAQQFRFVFMFNRAVPWRYREQMLERLVNDLVNQSSALL